MALRPLVLSSSAAVLVLAGCGEAKRPEPARTPEARAPAGDELSRLRPVIAGWADALAKSDVGRATEYFALPAVVAQAGELRLTTRAQVRTFNDGLPCGAELLSVERSGRFVVGTFRLKDRPGHKCDAPGGTARVALRFRGRRFSEWRQVPEPSEAPAAPSESA